MEKKQSVVMIKIDAFTLVIERGAFATDLPTLLSRIQRIVGSEVHVHQKADKVPFGRFLRPGIFSAAGFVTVLGLWRMLH